MPNIAITTYCNLKCPYCFAQQMFEEKNIKNISIEQFDKTLNWISSFVKKTHTRVGIIGGEPTLHPNFSIIMEHTSHFCYQHDTYGLLFTNGIYLNENTLKEIPDNMRILINYNDPKVLGQSNFILLQNNLNIIQELNWFKHNKVILGINLCKEINDYSFFKDIMLKYNFEKFRLAVAFPGQNIDMHQYYLSMKDKFLDMVNFANTYNFKINIDCRIPIFYFNKEESDLIYQVCNKQSYLKDCSHPTHEIMPDFMMTTCFAHYTNINCNNFSSFLDYYTERIEKKV